MLKTTQNDRKYKKKNGNDLLDENFFLSANQMEKMLILTRFSYNPYEKWPLKTGLTG